MLGDEGNAASRLVGALSATDAGNPRHDDEQRYRAVVSALLDVRPDHVGGYFDEALDAALAANRVDVHLARTLRWWQRASVRATEDFVAQIIPTVMAALDEADATAERDAAANATAWQQAQAIADLSVQPPLVSDSDSADDDSADDDRADDDSAAGDIAEGVDNDSVDDDSVDTTAQATRAPTSPGGRLFGWSPYLTCLQRRSNDPRGSALRAFLISTQRSRMCRSTRSTAC